MSSVTAPTVVPTRRSLAPDLARGFMLLAIALSHAPIFLSEAGNAALDRAVEFGATILLNDQARPMFVFLFGYGLTQLALSRRRRGADDLSVRKLLRRRGFWLIVIGFAHGLLLLPLDIIAPYGIASVLWAGMVHAKDKTLLWTAALTFLPSIALPASTVTIGMLTGTMPLGPGTVAISPDFSAQLSENAVNWAVGVVLSPLYLIPGMLLGMWAARRRVLEQPGNHLGLLRRVGWGGLALALAGKLPAALVTIDSWDAAPEAIIIAGVSYGICGYAGGIGAAALVGLAAHRLGERRNAVTKAMVALGQRSMTFYIFQSAAFLVLFHPALLRLTDIGQAGAVVAGLGVWILSLLLANALARNGYRGPTESLLRARTRAWEPV